MKLLIAARAVVKVGDGRGFIIEHRVELPPFKGKRLFRDRRLVVTAAHCLPYFPPCHGASYTHERTYKNLLGPLAGSKPNVWAECLFADPVADIAVLGSPDEQELYAEAASYDALTDAVLPLRIGNARNGRGWVLALDGHWISTILKVFRGTWGASLSIDPTEPGMSGSPILNHAGQAIGVIAIGAETVNVASGKRKNERCGPQPILAHALPGWLLPRKAVQS